jgi:hypothetical protein
MVPVGLVGLATLFAAATPASSVAADGVHFDPDSPAGKEYALPLDQARNEAAGDKSPEGTGSDEESGESAPLFGEGVSGGTADDADSEGEEGSGGEGQRARPDDRGAGGPRGQGERTGGELGDLADADDGYPLIAGVGLAALILLAGLGLGLGLRSLQRLRAG